MFMLIRPSKTDDFLKQKKAPEPPSGQGCSQDPPTDPRLTIILNILQTKVSRFYAKKWL